MKNVPECLGCGERDVTITEYPAHAGYCQGCHAEALGIGFHSADPEDDDDFDTPLNDESLERHNCGTVTSRDWADPIFNLFALVCVAAVLCGLIFQGQPKEDSMATASVAMDSGAGGARGSLRPVPRSEVKR